MTYWSIKFWLEGLTGDGQVSTAEVVEGWRWVTNSSGSWNDSWMTAESKNSFRVWQLKWLAEEEDEWVEFLNSSMFCSLIHLQLNHITQLISHNLSFNHCDVISLWARITKLLLKCIFKEFQVSSASLWDFVHMFKSRVSFPLYFLFYFSYLFGKLSQTYQRVLHRAVRLCIVEEAVSGFVLKGHLLIFGRVTHMVDGDVSLSFLHFGLDWSVLKAAGWIEWEGWISVQTFIIPSWLSYSLWWIFWWLLFLSNISLLSWNFLNINWMDDLRYTGFSLVFSQSFSELSQSFVASDPAYFWNLLLASKSESYAYKIEEAKH